jgi:hypothetical protein
MAGRSSTPSVALDAVHMDQVRMDEDDEEDDEVDGDHHEIANADHAAPIGDVHDDEVDEDDEEEDDEDDVDEDDEEGEDGADYEEDEADMEFEEVVTGLDGALDRIGGDISRLNDEVANLDRIMVGLQSRAGRVPHPAAQHLGHLAGYVAELLGRIPGASAVIEADGQRHRVFAVNGNGAAGGPAFSIGIPLDRYRYAAVAGLAEGGRAAADTSMSDHPLLR